MGDVDARSLRLGAPFVLVHLSCLAVFVVGWSPIAVMAAAATYLLRAFGITAIYHRGLSHRSFRMPRAVQAVGAFVGGMAAQRGPMWWVAHHRVHHRFTETASDPHSPRVDGMGRAHTGWQFDPENVATRTDLVGDLAKLPEMRFLDRYHHIPPAVLAVATFAFGLIAGRWWGWSTDGPQMIVWAFSISTVALWHATFSVNSLSHRFGRRHHDTPDDSTNNWLVAVLTLGEGWHNNHHRHPAAARHGFHRGQLDPTHRMLRILAAVGLVRDLRPVPIRLRRPTSARVAR